jgi:hypothetical protein
VGKRFLSFTEPLGRFYVLEILGAEILLNSHIDITIFTQETNLI